MYECMERAVTGDAKAKCLQQANLAETHAVANFTTVMNTINIHIFPTYANEKSKAIHAKVSKKAT